MEKFMIYSVVILLLVTNVFSKIQSVININRHGARSPKSFNNISSKLYYGGARSQLSVQGLRQHQLLGKWIYQKYVKEHKLLTKHYEPLDSLFISSPSQRAIFSGTAYIQGLYSKYIVKPVFGKEKSNMKGDNFPPIKDFKEQIHPKRLKEIPLKIVNSYGDFLFHSVNCKMTKDSKEEVKKEEFIKKSIFPEYTQEEIVSVVNDVKDHLPYLFTDISPEVYYTKKFMSTLFSYLKQIEPVLKETHDFKETTYQALRSFFINKNYGLAITDSRGVKLASSGFLNNILKYFDMHVKNDFINKKKLVLFSGHDTNLFAIWANLLDNQYLLNKCIDGKYNAKSYEFLIMSFASSFIVELHSHDFAKDIYYVKIIFNGEEINDGFHKDLVYEDILGGFEYENFKKFLLSRIDPFYRELYCNVNDDIDYTKPNNQKFADFE